jgi:hypothetical protein
MGRAGYFIWLILVVAVLALLGQTMGWYDVPILRDVRAAIPLGQSSPQAAPTLARPTLTIAPKPAASTSSPTVAQSAGCTATAPRFVLGAAALKATLGAPMGDPIECERVVDAEGNTEQKTTTGLAYYRARNNIAAFTNGFDHWAQTPTGVVHWVGDDVEPPPGAERVQ